MTLADKTLFTVAETGEHLGLSCASVYRLIGERLLTRVYPRPRAARITRESITAHIERSTSSEAVRQGVEMGRANRKHQEQVQAQARAEQKKHGFLGRFGLGG